MQTWKIVKCKKPQTFLNCLMLVQVTSLFVAIFGLLIALVNSCINRSVFSSLSDFSILLRSGFDQLLTCDLVRHVPIIIQNHTKKQRKPRNIGKGQDLDRPVG